MCGIIGIISDKEDVIKQTFIGLLCLQHRGQDSAGILSFNGSLNIKKDKGMVEQIFSERDLENLSAKMAIGHTRYPTIGSDFRKDAQPFFITFPYKIGMAYNGNITNYFELKKEFEKKNCSFTSSCDVETLLNVFGESLLKEKNLSVSKIFGAVKKVFKRVKGAYSVVVLIGGKGMLAFRDKKGIKPLSLMKKKSNGITNYAFTSESCSLMPAGYELVRSINPGEAVFIDQNSMKIHSKIFSKKKSAHCMFEWVYFARAESVLDEKVVYGVRQNLGRELARLWKQTGLKADVVFPVPDTSITAATIFAEELKLPFRQGLMKNRYIGRTFIMGSQAKRENGVALKLHPIDSEIKGKSIILVDDSIVRGTTSKKIVKLLKERGAKKIFLLSTCPPISFPCFYGIDMPVRSELIASNKDTESIREFVEADFLLYNDLRGLKKAIGLKGICTACLDGRYPVKISENAIKEIENARKIERKKLRGEKL